MNWTRLSLTLLAIACVALPSVCVAQPSAEAQRRRSSSGSYESAFSDTAHAANQRAGQTFRILRCAQSPGQRTGYCFATVPVDADLSRALVPLQATLEPERAAADWANSPNSGCALSGWLREHPAARGHSIPSQVFRRNGTRLHRIWSDGAEVCLDLSVPH